MLDSVFERALRSTDPVAQLRELAIERVNQGNTREAVLGEFEQVRRQLRSADREEDEDHVTDVMDFLTGWCSPHMKLEAPAAVPRCAPPR